VDNAHLEAHPLPLRSIASGDWLLASQSQVAGLQAMEKAGTSLAQLGIRVERGITTGADKLFLLDVVDRHAEVVLAVSSLRHAPFELEREAIRTILRGRDIGLSGKPNHKMCLCPYAGNGKLMSERYVRRNLPRCYKYLQQFASLLKARPGVSSVCWYGFQQGTGLPTCKGPRIIAPAFMSARPFVLDPGRNVLLHGSVLSITAPEYVEPGYLLGVLNSTVFWQYARHRSKHMGPCRQLARTGLLRDFPIVVPRSRQQVALAQRIVSLAHRCARIADDGERQSLYVEVDLCVSKIYGIDAVQPDARCTGERAG
jgi:adenine-specific DNA-methyltransferase